MLSPRVRKVSRALEDSIESYLYSVRVTRVSKTLRRAIQEHREPSPITSRSLRSLSRARNTTLAESCENYASIESYF